MEFKMSDSVYNVLKWIAQVILPAIGALYFGLAEIWHFPFASEVVGTITVIDAFLGAILGISTANYNAAKRRENEVVDPDPFSNGGPIR